MKKILVILALGTLVAAAALIGQGFTYVGAKKCAMCHRSETQGRQYVIWEGTKHAKSVEALTSDKAVENAKAMGVDKPAEDPRCLKCHAPLADKAPDFKAEGVTCEICHGPGSGYQKLSIMKDRALAVKNGLVLYGGPEAIKAHCLTCHDDPHGIKFDFASAWDKIKHPVPAK